MRGSRRNEEAVRRSQERRAREDGAPRLATAVPALESLALAFEEIDTAGTASVAHKRHVVVASAPALFEVVCGNPDCKEGGHDLTTAIMRALGARQTSFEGRDACHGSIGSGQCARELKYTGTATYKS